MSAGWGDMKPAEIVAPITSPQFPSEVKGIANQAAVMAAKATQQLPSQSVTGLSRETYLDAIAQHSPQPPVAWTNPASTDIDDKMKERLKEENLEINRNGVLMLHMRLQEKLALIKEDEMNVRRSVVKLFVHNPKEGVNTVELGNGFLLKANITYNYVVTAEHDKVEENLTRIAACGNDGPFIAQRIIKWTADLSIGEYHMLEEAAKAQMPDAIKQLALVNELIEKREGAPKVNVKEPKRKGEQ